MAADYSASYGGGQEQALYTFTIDSLIRQTTVSRIVARYSIGEGEGKLD